MSLPAASTPSQDEPALPAQGTRTVVSFLLFLHLFALFVALVSTESASLLTGRLQAVPGVRPYLQLLFMNLSYRYFLTSAGRMDVDFHLEADMALPDGSRKVVVFPEPGTRPMLRYRRLERLVYQVAFRSRSPALEGSEAPLVQAIAGQLFSRHGAAQGRQESRAHRLRVRGHLLLSMNDALAGSDPFGENYYWTAYEAAAWYLPDGQVDLLRATETSDAAQVGQPEEP